MAERKRKSFTEDEKLKICKLWQQGYTATEICKKVESLNGRKPQTLYPVLIKAGLYKKKPANDLRRYKVNDHYFDEINTEHKAYWLGFLMADGCVVRTDSHKTYNRLEVNLKSSDYMHLKKLNNSLNANYPIKIFNKTNKTLDFDYSIARLRITSSILVSDLIKNNITPNKTGKEIIPNTVPKKLIKHFIRGFLDGDGTITVNKTSGFCSSSITIIEEINNFIYKELNMKCNILKSNDNVPIYTISYSSKKSKILLDYLYKDSKIYLDRKYKRYIDLFSSPIQ